MRLKYLSPLKPLPDMLNYKILSFDVETYGPKNKFYMGSVYDGEQYYISYDKEDMGQFLLKRKFSNYRIFATNLQFDLGALYYPFNDKWERFMLGSKYIYAKYRTYKNSIKRGKRAKRISRTWTFLDSLNVAPLSVKQMGKVINIPKLPNPNFLGQKPTNKPYCSLLKNKQTLSEKEYLEIYNLRDSEITYKFMRFFSKALFDLGGKLKNTIAGCSMDIFRRKYMPENSWIKRPDIDMILKTHSGYYGGRVEVFQIGYDENKNYYDINSLYPYVMQNNFPDTKTIRYSDKPNESLLEYEGIANVKMYCPYMKYPYLPVRDERILFPTGNIEGIYTHFEIREALKLGYELHKIHWSIYYLETVKTFGDFIKSMYAKRLQYANEGNDGMKYVVKILMNSLYGRWGVKANNKNVGILKQPDTENGLWWDEIPDDKLIYWDENDTPWITDMLNDIPTYANPIISTYVTAYARTELYKLISKYEPIYCDTDSIVTNKTISTSNKLGALKKEYKIDKCWFLFPKAYRIIGTNEKGVNVDLIKWKGIPHAHLRQFWNNDFQVTFDKIIKTKEGLRRGLRLNEIVKMTKRLKDIKHKRTPIKTEFDFLIENSDTEPLKIA